MPSTGAHLWADRFEGALDGHLRSAGPDHRERRRRDRAAAGAGRDRARQAQADREPRRLRLLSARNGELLSAQQGVHRRGTAVVLQRRSSSIRISLRPMPWRRGAIIWRKINGWMTDPVQETAETARLARRALELGQDDAVALARGAHALGYVVGDIDAAIIFIDRALVLNPNLAVAYWASGWTRLWFGELETAITHFARAMRLSPLDPYTISMQAGMALGHFLAGRYDEASSWVEKALWEQENYVTTLRIAAAIYAAAGRFVDAQKALARLRELQPALRVSNVKEWVPLRRPEDLCKGRGRLAQSRAARMIVKTACSQCNRMSVYCSAPRRRGSPVEEESTQRVVD